MVTGVFMVLPGVIGFYFGISRDDKVLPGITWGYSGLQGVTGVTRGYKGLQAVIGG